MFRFQRHLRHHELPVNTRKHACASHIAYGVFKPGRILYTSTAGIRMDWVKDSGSGMS
jgi:hypothetical protein